MTMLSEQLRQVACGGSNWNVLLENAATAIERLTAENERLRHALLGLPGGGYALEQIVMRGKGET